MKFVVLFFLTLLVFSTKAQTTYYVSTSGNDTNNGTSISNAFKTIQKAAQTATAGSIVNILAGTYNERVITQVFGLPNNYITFQNYQNDIVKIDGAGKSGWGLFLIYGVGYIKLKGIHFMQSDSNAQAWQPALIIGNKSQYIEVHHCTFTDLWSSNSTGIALYGNDTTAAGLHNILIDSCEFGNKNFKMNQGIGITGNTYQCTVSNNLLHHITAQAIGLYGSDSTSRSVFDFARNINVVSNEIHDVYNVTPGNYRQAILVSGARNCLLEKNKIHHCDMGITITAFQNYGITENIIFRENLVYQSYQEGLSVGVYNYTANTGRVKYCNIHHNTFFENCALNNSAEIVFFPFDSSTISNNIFYCNNQNNMIYTWFYGVGWQHNSMDYNLYCSPFINPSTMISDWDGSYNTGFGIYKTVSNTDFHSDYADPLFVHPYDSIPDFHIYNNSPAKDSGDAAFVVSNGETDCFNQQRIFNYRVDIGAVENQNDYAPPVIQLGVSKLNNETMSIYPNPCKDNLKITQFENLKIERMEVIDVMGRVCISIINPKSKIVNVESLQSGIYFLKAIDNNGLQQVFKFVKE